MTRTAGLGVFSLALTLTVGASAQDSIKPKTAELNKPAPDFTLTDLNGKTHRLSDYTKAKKVVVLEWFNPGCPWVKRVHNKGAVIAIANKYKGKEVVWLAINSGAPGKQGHGKKTNQAAAKKWKIGYPILTDESGTVGRLYKARTTPHMFIVAPDGKLAYTGALDNRKEEGHVNYVDQAVTALLASKAVPTPKTRPYG